jgi:hypothetical protein
MNHILLVIFGAFEGMSGHDLDWRFKLNVEQIRNESKGFRFSFRHRRCLPILVWNEFHSKRDLSQQEILALPFERGYVVANLGGKMTRTSKLVLAIGRVITLIASCAVLTLLPASPKPATAVAAPVRTATVDSKPAMASAPAETSTPTKPEPPALSYSSPSAPSYSPSPSYSEPKVQVHGYTRKNGTYVAPYSRSAPRSRR